jgi:hypothetical protein
VEAIVYLATYFQVSNDSLSLVLIPLIVPVAIWMFTMFRVVSCPRASTNELSKSPYEVYPHISSKGTLPSSKNNNNK